jgi:uncharacterized protein YkwD
MNKYYAVLLMLCALSAAACRTTRSKPIDDTLVRAPGASSRQYDAGPAGLGALVGRTPSPELAAAVESTARLRGHGLLGDLRLAAVAAFCEAQGDATPPPELLEFVMRHLGIYDPRAELVLVGVPKDDARAALEAALGPRLSGARFTHYGAALVARADSARLAIVLTTRAVEMAPVPRIVSVFEPIRLRGRVLDGATNPRVVIHAEGAPRSVVNTGPGPDFDAQVPTPKPGTYRLEIEADGETGARTLAKLAVYVGKEPPLFWKRTQTPAPFDAVFARSQLMASIDAERKRAGLVSLIEHPRLDQVAEAHTAEMRDKGYVAHQSPVTGGPADRVAQAGLSPVLLLENIARGTDAATVHATVLREAGQRANLLHPAVTHVGVGVVPIDDAHGRSWLVTQLFAQLPGSVDTSAAAPTLLAAWNEARAGRGAPTLALDPELTKVAEEAARTFVSTPGMTEQAVIDSANAELQRFSVAYRRVAAILVLAQSLDEARTLEPPLDPAVRSVGIAAMQGDRSDRGGRVLAIALVLAWPR